MRYNNFANKLNKNLQGGVKVPTGGTAHEPQGMIRCNSEADSIVWMKEETLLTSITQMMGTIRA